MCCTPDLRPSPLYEVVGVEASHVVAQVAVLAGSEHVWLAPVYVDTDGATTVLMLRVAHVVLVPLSRFPHDPAAKSGTLLVSVTQDSDAAPLRTQ
jgi:hypothetical protein